jgi:hypothetical protein
MKVHLIEEAHATTRPRLIIQEQVVGHATHDQLVVEYKEERQIVTEMKLMPREAIEEVMTTKVVEVPCVDCHGKPIVKYETVPCVRQVKVVRYEVVPVPREVIVRVPCVKHVPQLMEIRRLCPYETEEAAICIKLRAEIEHNKVDVPPCPAPPAPVKPPCEHPH